MCLVGGVSTHFTTSYCTLTQRVFLCMQVEWIDRSGLGHTLACWGKYMQDAVDNGLTYYTSFVSAAHDVCNLHDFADLFGLHSVFYWSRAPSPDAVRVQVGTTYGGGFGCTSKSIKEAVEKYRKNNGTFDCQEKDVVFQCNNRFEDFAERHVNTIEGYAIPMRAAFNAGYRIHYHKYMMPSISTALNQGIVVVVHIRRGDVLKSKIIDVKLRLTSFKFYESIIRSVLYLRNNETSSISTPIHFFLLAEGSTNSDMIVEYDEHNAHNQFMLNVTSLLSDACNLENKCNIETLYNASFFESFTAMCQADVLVTSTSGFAWTAGALCTPPMTIAVPAWDSYNSFENVVYVKPINNCPLYSNQCIGNLEGGEQGWREMLKIKELKKIEGIDGKHGGYFERKDWTKNFSMYNNVNVSFKDVSYGNRSYHNFTHGMKIFRRERPFVDSRTGEKDYGKMLQFAKTLLEH